MLVYYIYHHTFSPQEFIVVKWFSNCIIDFVPTSIFHVVESKITDTAITVIGLLYKLNCKKDTKQILLSL